MSKAVQETPASLFLKMHFSTSLPRTVQFFLALVLSMISALGAETEGGPRMAPQPAIKVPADATSITNAPVKELGQGRYQIGQVILDKKERTIKFPAAVNMKSGVVEYLIVHARGKVHESVLRTETEPSHVHLAMLLLGAKAATQANPADFYNTEKEIPGDAVSVMASWKSSDGERKVNGESLLKSAKSPDALTLDHWVYNGSQFVDGNFVAQQEGSIISLIADPYALVNNPRKDRDDDELWNADSAGVPPVNTPVTVVIKLNPSK